MMEYFCNLHWFLIGEGNLVLERCKSRSSSHGKVLTSTTRVLHKYDGPDINFLKIIESPHRGHHRQGDMRVQHILKNQNNQPISN